MTAAAMEASASEAPCMEAACVDSAAEAGLSARGVRTDYAAMIEAAEGTGTDADCSVVSKPVAPGVDTAKAGTAQFSVTETGATNLGMP